MIKLVLILIFYAALMFPAISSGAQEVVLRFPPIPEPLRIPLGYAIWIFATYGGLAVMVVAVMDRMELSRKNKKVRKQLVELQKEVEHLRHIMTMEKEP